MMLMMVVLMVCLVLIRPQQTERERERAEKRAQGVFESVDDLPYFHRMMTGKIGRLVPPEMQPYHRYYAHFLYPYIPYSEAQLEYIREGNEVMPATPPHFGWLETAFNENIMNGMNGMNG
ncbi:hypothetical protein COOONC_21896 [Cooperia oncophora]